MKLLTLNFLRFSGAFSILTSILSTSSYKSLKHIDFFMEFFDKFYQQTSFFEVIRKILNQGLSPMKKLNVGDVHPLIKLLNVAYFPLDFFHEFGQVSNFLNKTSHTSAYNSFISYTDSFVLQILTVPRAGFLLRSLSKPHHTIKSLFQGFLYQHFVDPLADDLDQAFLKTFSKSNNEFLYLLGNSIEIIDSMLRTPNFSLSDHYSLLKLISLSLNFVTPAFLKGLLGYQWSDDKDLWYLRSQFLNILSQDFAERAFVMALELGSNQGGFSDKFNPYCTLCLCDIYSTLIMICYRNEETQSSVSRITSVLALQPELIRKVFSFLDSFYGIQNYLNGKLHRADVRKFLNLMIIYTMGLSNSLFVSDRDDFQEYLSKDFQKMLIKFIKGLIQLLSRRLWLLDSEASKEPLDENLQYDFLCVHGSRLLQLLYEFNQKINFLDLKEWSLPEGQVKALVNEVFQLKFQHIGLLRRLPFSFPFEYRLQILMTVLENERNQHPEGFQLTIRRENLFEDGFQAFQAVSKTSLKSRLRVFYIDEFGMEEKGVDGGGIFKEFLNDICKIVFDPAYGLFKITEQNQQLYPNPAAKQLLGDDYLEIYSFVGSLVGRALYDNILIGMMLSPFFLRRWLGKHNFLNELQSYDPELYNNLKFLKTYKGDAGDLGLNFTIVDSNDNNREIELIPHGKSISVDNTNKFRYIYLMANYKLNETTKNQTNAFLNGLQKVVPMQYLQFFDEYELQMVLSGALNALDIEDLKKNVDLKGYSMNESYMKDFWKILGDFNEADRNLFVKFVTACERPPLLGFAKLTPLFTIQMVNSEGDKKLPTSATCFNKLNLPKYSKKEILKEKLLLAIRSAKGFYLT